MNSVFYVLCFRRALSPWAWCPTPARAVATQGGCLTGAEGHHTNENWKVCSFGYMNVYFTVLTVLLLANINFNWTKLEDLPGAACLNRHWDNFKNTYWYVKQPSSWKEVTAQVAEASLHSYIFWLFNLLPLFYKMGKKRHWIAILFPFLANFAILCYMNAAFGKRWGMRQQMAFFQSESSPVLSQRVEGWWRCVQAPVHEETGHAGCSIRRNCWPAVPLHFCVACRFFFSASLLDSVRGEGCLQGEGMALSSPPLSPEKLLSDVTDWDKLL